MTSRAALVAPIVAIVAITAGVSSAHADDGIPGHRIDRPLTGVVAVGALGLSFGLSVIPIRDEHGLWRHELFGAVDDTVHDNFSLRASSISDGLVVATLVAPVVYLTGTSIEDADGDRLLIYGESLAINLALYQGVKRLVQRPRPYLYSKAADAMQFAEGAGDDAHLSFYSGHAASTFCAATTGAYLVAASSGSRRERMLAWAGGFAGAAATANLRVRAGKHFYSDVAVGALVGIAVGYLVPALHADDGAYVPDTSDLLAAGAGLLGGVVISQLIPLGARDDRTTLGQHGLHPQPLQLAPVALSNGAGFSIGGVF